MIKDYPAVPEYQFDLAQAHINRGLLLDTVMRRPDEAKAAYEKGFGLLEKTAANFPQDRMIRARIASNIRSVAGYLARDPKRYLDADGLRLRDVAMHESMARDFPDDPRWPEQVVHGHRLRGSAFLDAGHPREATAAFADAVRALERWSTRFPPALHKHLLDETRTYLAGAKARHAWGLITHPDPKARRPEEALTLAQDAVESAPREGLTWKALGMAYFRLRRWQEAAEALAKADRLGPDLNQTFSPFIRAMADWMLGKHEAARKWYDVGAVWLLRTNPSDAIQLAFRKEAAAMLGVSENATARQKQAAMDYWGRYVTLVIEADPQATWAFRERGLGHGKNGNWKEAVADFRQAVRLDPDHVLTHCHLGQALARSGRVDEAVAAFREALRLENSGKVRWQILRPALMLAIEAAPGKYDPALAVDLANQIVVLTPTHTAAWTALGIAHYRANNWKEAITALEKSWQTRIEKGRTQNIPDLTSFCTNFFLAMAQSKSGNMVEARKAYDLAVAMMDNLPYRDRELVRLCTEAQAVLHLKPELQEAVRRDPNSAKAHFELGRLLQGESAWLDAAKHYQKAIELQSAAYPTARGELISSLLNAARTNPSEEVVAAYRKASAIIPGYSTLHFDLGRAHARLGRWKEAAEAYARGLEIDPGNIRAWYYGVPLHLRAGDVEGYRKLCAKMLQRFGSTSDPVHAEWTAVTCSLAPDAVADPNRLAALGDVAVTGTENRPYRNFLERAKGLAELRAGRLAEAEKWLERSDPETHGGPEDAAIFAALGIARLRSGKHEEAAAALAAAKAMLKTRKMPDPTQGNWVDLWPDWLHAEILVREAENLLNKK